MSEKTGILIAVLPIAAGVGAFGSFLWVLALKYASPDQGRSPCR